MNRCASLLALVVFLGGGFQTYAAEPEAQANSADPLAKVYPILQDATAKLSSVAVLNVESNGTTEDISGVQLALIKSLAKRSGLLMISPDDVRKTVGVEFESSPAALAVVAKKCSAQAVLYPQIIKSNEELELTLLLVGDNAAILLDRAFALQSLPPPAERASAPQQNLPTLPPPPPPPPPAGPPAPPVLPDTAAAKFAQQALSLAMHDRVRPGYLTTYVGPFGGVEYEHPPQVIGEDWFILQGGEYPISERRLALLVGRDDIIQRIDKRVAPFATARNVGVGLTVGGILTAGIAAPFVNSDNTRTSTLASAFVIAGGAASLTGIVLWMIYGPQVSAIESPFPARHTISQDEAQQMVNDYNHELLQKLGIPDPARPAQSSYEPSWHFALSPEAHGGLSAVLGFRY